MFCVYLTSYSGNKLPPFYIGSTSLSKIENGYRGSVKSKLWKDLWRAELKASNDLFRTKIVSTHQTRKEAFDKEEKLQKLLKCKQNPLYTNEAIANNRFSGVSFHSPETRARMSASRRGKKLPPRSAEYRAKMAASQSGKKASAETRAQMSATRTGMKMPPRSEEYIQHQRAIQTGKKHKPWSPERRARFEEKKVNVQVL